MVSRLRIGDVPEPWFPPKEPNAKRSEENPMCTEDAVADASIEQHVLKESNRRGRGRPKGKTKVSHAPRAEKGKAKVNSLSALAVDVVLGSSMNPIADAEELRRKREEDVVACGRRVRRVQPTPKRKRTPTVVTTDSISVHAQEVAGTKEIALRHHDSLQKSFHKENETGHQNNVDDVVFVSVEDLEQRKETEEPSFVRYVQKESVDGNMQELLHDRRILKSTIVREHGPHEIDCGMELEDMGRARGDSIQQRSRSALKEADDDSEERARCQSDSQEEEQVAQRQRGTQYADRSARKNFMTATWREGRYNPGLHGSTSRQGWTEGQHVLEVISQPLYYKERAYGSRYDNELWHSSKLSNEEHPRSGRNASSSPEIVVQQRKHALPEEGQRSWNKSLTSYSSRSPFRIPSEKYDTAALQTEALSVRNRGQKLKMLPKVERIERRRSQSYREAEMEGRQRDGKKPFYVTLCPEGKPYGPGKRAWVAEINKLAKWLDPSCTYIRKQTFEDVQTFKVRLNETFDYSGTLNEDFLRGMMGKAVTKKRAELILHIKNKGKQPVDLDYPMWRRLKKLARSKQWEEKSEQGRYANACRKTLGRTGSRGENGIREKLRSFLGRSPDPDEVEEEMQRDKGFGGQKRKVSAVVAKLKRNSMKEFSDEDSHSEEDSSTEGNSSEGEGEQQYKQHASYVDEIGERGGHVVVPHTEMREVKTPPTRRSSIQREEERHVEDDYIAKLEAEIRRLQAQSRNAATLQTVMALQSTKSMPSTNKRGIKDRNMKALNAGHMRSGME